MSVAAGVVFSTSLLSDTMVNETAVAIITRPHNSAILGLPQNKVVAT